MDPPPKIRLVSLARSRPSATMAWVFGRCQPLRRPVGGQSSEEVGVYPFDEVPLLCLLAVLGGAETFVDIEKFDPLRRFRASPRSTGDAMWFCERSTSASTRGSCHVTRVIPMRQKASGSRTSLDVKTMRPAGRSNHFNRSTIRKWARKLTANDSSKPSEEDASPRTT